MNKSFKVVFSKARSAFMVVNEATSSIQAKGTKTVVAVAAAMVAGGALAADWVDAPAGVTVVDSTQTAEQIAAGSQFKFQNTEAGTPVFYTGDFAEGKTLWVDGTTNGSKLTGLATGSNDVTNKGTIYVTSNYATADGTALPWEHKAMLAQNGKKAINVGTIVAKNGYGMMTGTAANGASVINNGNITVIDRGVAMELNGGSGVNNGTIDVGATAVTEDQNVIDFTHGVQFDTTASEFTNNGQILASGATTAINVKSGATGSTIKLGQNSNVDGLINIGANDVKLNFNGTKDELSIKTTEGVTGTTITVDTGADVTLVDNNKATFDKVTVENGKLSASIWGVDNTFKNVTVNEGGVFNITKLNSRVDGEPIKGDVKGDRLLLARDTTWTLNGGKLLAEGSETINVLKIGTATGGTKGAGTLNITGGDYTFGTVQVYGQGKLDVSGEGLLVVDNLEVLGTTTVSGALTVNKDLDITSTGSLTLNGGDLKSTADNLFTITEDAWSGKTGLTATSGTITVTDNQSLTVEDLKKAAAAYQNANVMFDNVDVDLKDETELKFDSGLKTTLINETASVASDSTDKTKATAAVGDNTTVGFASLKVADDVTAVTTTGTGTLILSGNTADGNVITTEGKVESLTVAGALELGKDEFSKGVVNVDNLKANDLKVVGDFSANNVEVASADIDGVLTVNTISGTGVTVGGVLAATNVAAGVTVDGGMLVLNAGNNVTGTVNTTTQTGSIALFTAAARNPVEPTEVTGIVTTNANAPAIINGLGLESELSGKQVLYLDNTVSLVDAGQVNIGSGTGANGSLTLGQNGFALVDASAFSATKPMVAGNVTTSGDSEIRLINMNQTGNLLLTDGTVTVAETTTISTDNLFIKANVAENVINATFNQAAVGGDEELAGAMEYAMLADAQNGAVLKAIGNEAAFLDGNVLNDTGIHATEEYLATPVVAGVYNVAYDAAEQVNGALARRNVEPTTGMGVWADVFYSGNEAKKIYGGQGYSADIYGGMIGFDTVFSCGAKLGAALTIGTGDADSERSVSKFSNDADFYGLSVYTGKNVGDTSMYLSADASYLWVENDIGGNVAGASVAESIDSSVFTIGARADWNVYSGDVVTVAPHIGVRYTSIDVDDYRGLSTSTMDVVEMPVGIKVAGNFDAAGMKIVPAFDFTVVPQIGDKDVDTVLGAVDVIDNLYNASLGVDAVMGNFAFGLNYKHGFGQEDRANNTFNLNVRYTF